MEQLPEDQGVPDIASAAALDDIFDGADFGLAIWDLGLRFVRVNPALARMNSCPAAKHLGRTVAEALPETSGPVARALAQTAQRGGSARRVTVEGPGKNARRFEYVIHPLRRDGELVGLWAAVFEITDAYLAREARRRLAAELEDEHRIATQLQVSLSPDVLPVVPGADIASAFHPAGAGHEIGGDLLDVFRVGRPQCWMVVIGDVCGKGAEAAALTALTRYTLRAAAIREGAEPAKLLAQLNEAILRQHDDMRFVTVVCAFLAPGENGGLRLTTCVAGHPPPLKVDAAGGVSEVATGGVLLGVWDEPQLQDTVVDLAPGERLVLYTDGVTEAGAPDEQLGESGLIKVLGRVSGDASSARTIAAVERTIDPTGLAPGRDDLAMLVVRPAPQE